MSYYYLLIFVSSFAVLFCSSNADPQPEPPVFILAVKKDDRTLLHYTTIEIETTSLNLAIDLGGKFLWFRQPDKQDSPGNLRRIPCNANLCKIIRFEPLQPGCWKNCAGYAHNPFTGILGYADLTVDTVHINATNGATYDLDLPFFNFSTSAEGLRYPYSDPAIMEGGLPTSSVGVLGLGRVNNSLHTQLASAYKIDHKFTICFPSSSKSEHGSISFGNPRYNFTVEPLFTTTPLIQNPVRSWPTKNIGDISLEYFVMVNSIKVDNKSLSFDNSLLSINERGIGGTSIRSVRPYTILHKSIYRALVDEYIKACESKNITEVQPISRFGACFDLKSIRQTKTGPDLPVIDFELQGEDAHWRLHGANTVVKVNNNTSCLAFVDGGIYPRTSIVFGGHQLQNYLIQFDISKSEVRFSPSLLNLHSRCSLI